MLTFHIKLQSLFICLSFFCIVYNTKLQHGDPDVRITLLRYFQAITKQKKGTSALFWSCPRLDRQSSVFKETLCKTPLEGQKALHTIQYRQVVVDKFAKWLFNIASSEVVSSMVFQNGWKPLYAPNKSWLDLQQCIFTVQIVEEGSWGNNRRSFSIQIRLSQDKSYIHLGRCTCRISHRGKAQWGSRAKDHDTNRATWSTSKVPYTLYPL